MDNIHRHRISQPCALPVSKTFKYLRYSQRAGFIATHHSDVTWSTSNKLSHVHVPTCACIYIYTYICACSYFQQWGLTVMPLPGLHMLNSRAPPELRSFCTKGLASMVGVKSTGRLRSQWIGLTKLYGIRLSLLLISLSESKSEWWTRHLSSDFLSISIWRKRTNTWTRNDMVSHAGPCLLFCQGCLYYISNSIMSNLILNNGSDFCFQDIIS